MPDRKQDTLRNLRGELAQAVEGLAGVTDRLVQVVATDPELSAPATVQADEEFRITVWDDAAEELCGWKAHEVIGQDWRKIGNGAKGVTEEELQENGEAVAALIDGHAIANTFTIPRKDGKLIRVYTQAYPIIVKGVFRGCVGIVRRVNARQVASSSRDRSSADGSSGEAS